MRGDRFRAWAFAPVDDPGEVVVEGRVADRRAWSTSKVLVVAAYLDAAVAGDPDRLTNANRRLISAALTRSDADAITAIRDQIPGSSGAAMTAVLRSVGDRTTAAPDRYQGTMAWSLREQVRFMIALEGGRVVSRAASRYLSGTMRPIEEHSWGLGRIGARPYKGGWLRANTATRQFGVVDGYAVAIATTSGPAIRQTDGDAAHVTAMDALARQLEQRLAWERRCR